VNKELLETYDLSTPVFVLLANKWHYAENIDLADEVLTFVSGQARVVASYRAVSAVSSGHPMWIVRS
jgi:hypothetical protein